MTGCAPGRAREGRGLTFMISILSTPGEGKEGRGQGGTGAGKHAADRLRHCSPGAGRSEHRRCGAPARGRSAGWSPCRSSSGRLWAALRLGSHAGTWDNPTQQAPADAWCPCMHAYDIKLIEAFQTSLPAYAKRCFRKPPSMRAGSAVRTRSRKGTFRDMLPSCAGRVRSWMPLRCIAGARKQSVAAPG